MKKLSSQERDPPSIPREMRQKSLRRGAKLYSFKIAFTFPYLLPCFFIDFPLPQTWQKATIKVDIARLLDTRGRNRQKKKRTLAVLLPPPLLPCELMNGGN